MTKEEKAAKVREKARRWREANPEKVREKARRWRAANMEQYRETKKRWREANPEKSRESSRRYYERNRELVLRRTAEWRKKDPKRAADIHTRHRKKYIQWYRAKERARRHGMSPAELSEFIAARPVCEVCGVAIRWVTERGSGRDGFAVIDHDHATETVRGALCHYCNLTIGNAKDNPRILRAAAEYLELRTAHGRP